MMDGWSTPGFAAAFAWRSFIVRLAARTEADRVFAEVRQLLSVAEADHPLWPRLSQ
jgi:hypothetical protein